MADDSREFRATDRPFRTLRPHNKSRLGCTACKKRKVKCDETRPICGTCRLRNADCEYPLSQNAPSSTVVVLSRKPKSSASADLLASRVDAVARRPGISTNALSIDALSPPPFGPIDHVDMKVLWFYTSATSQSFSGEGADQKPLQDTLQNAVVQSAFESPFLMSTLLALASLHMRSLGQDIGAKRSLQYCGTAFEGHRKAIVEAHPKTHGALLANALLLSLLASPALRRTGEPRLLLVEWMLMWRGLSSVFNITGSDCVASSGLSALFSRPEVQPYATSATVPTELLTMLSRVSAEDEEILDSPTYQEALRCLGSLYLHLFEYGIDNKMVMRIATWFTVVPAGFVALARAEKPRAMVILAHYAAFLRLADSFWWLTGVGDSSIYDIWQNLPTEWREYIQLPIGVMGAAGKEEAYCLLLNHLYESDFSPDAIC
jgi:hypothetical protein